MAGEMEYLYMMFGLGLCVPVAVYLGMRWLSANYSHMRQQWRAWKEAAKANYESEMIQTREILRRKKHG